MCFSERNEFRSSKYNPMRPAVLFFCICCDVGWGQGSSPFGANEKEEGKRPELVLVGRTSSGVLGSHCACFNVLHSWAY